MHAAMTITPSYAATQTAPVNIKAPSKPRDEAGGVPNTSHGHHCALARATVTVPHHTASLSTWRLTVKRS
eukprot:XP_001699274.1 predicted protein [Chlamydomonas reinhardtii]